MKSNIYIYIYKNFKAFIGVKNNINIIYILLKFTVRYTYLIDLNL